MIITDIATMPLMEKLVNFSQERPLVAAAAFSVAAFCTVKIAKTAVNAFISRTLASGMQQLDQKSDHYDNGIVYLHLFPRATVRQHLNMSPFGIKVESWLRLHKIPHKTIETFQMSSSTQQIPYIMLDGEEVADSNKILHFLEKKYNISESEGLSTQQLAVAHSLLRMVDESLSWTYVVLRYLRYENFYPDYMYIPAPNFMKKFVLRQIKEMVRPRLVLHGIGRKSEADITELARDDILAISQYLDKKQFLMGDTITKVDCAVFGHLCQIVYNDIQYPHKKIIREECPNLTPYLDRIKDKIWPDWDELVHPML